MYEEPKLTILSFSKMMSFVQVTRQVQANGKMTMLTKVVGFKIEGEML